ncbi:MAG TPA: ATP-binding protein, partial [Ktedonobacterales bacterium]|nr:ATP-binding protein [Ktedonobacterales bacterium]
QQVLLNLLSNAITHAPDSKTIEVRMRRVGNEAEVQVEDHGPGIPAEQLSNVFSRFFQVVGSRTHQHKGLGLGLYIASGIMKAHDGSIDVASVEGKGTTFTLRLPLAEG